MWKAIAALASVAVALTLATTGSAAGSARTLDLVFPGTKSAYVDTGKKGYSPGDYFLATGPVLDRVGGKRVGGLAGIWTLLGPAADDVSMTVRLPAGTLYVSGQIRHAAKRSVLRVVGGAGAYAGARGTATFRYLSETTGAMRVHLAA